MFSPILKHVQTHPNSTRRQPNSFYYWREYNGNKHFFEESSPDTCHMPLAVTGDSNSASKATRIRNAMRYNNRNNLLHLSFTLKISIFSEGYI